ncbi:MAG: histidine ammonia-lyase [Deltaproteobacteria bacterium]|nr:histidine ammonia-lyase [Deltaproteobacteria bacterium]
MVARTVTLDGRTLSLADVAEVAHGRARVEVTPAVRARLVRARAHVDLLAAGSEPHYGINTGFGALAEVKIAPDQVGLLQKNLIESHAVGVGEPLPAPEARALLLLRAQTLAVGHSGCRDLVLDHLVALLNANVAPLVPRKGSVGASGDLAPLAHTALLLLGQGDAFLEGRPVSAAEALSAAELPPLELKAKEGLALINGTQAMMAVGVLALLEAERLAKLADVVGATSLDALQGTWKAFDPRIHAARPHPGQRATAKNLLALLEGSEIMESHKDCAKVQDPYSLRCMPQVHGATRDALAWVRSVLERELNSATDNPLVFLDGDHGVAGDEVLSGGNFHGQPVAMALDLLAIAAAELANISERRIEQLLNPSLSSGLPPFLAPQPGLNSGFMIVQVTAASLVNENKIFCHPAVVDSIPSSANREDHVSMGMTSANKAALVIENVRRVLGLELLCACQGLDLRKLAPGRALRRVYARVRREVAFAPVDRAFGVDLAAMERLVRTDDVLTAAGPLA